MSLALNSRFQDSCVPSQHSNLGQSLQHEKKVKTKSQFIRRELAKGEERRRVG